MSCRKSFLFKLDEKKITLLENNFLKFFLSFLFFWNNYTKHNYCSFNFNLAMDQWKMPPLLSMGEASSSSGHLTADDYDDERKVSAFLSIYLITTSLHEETINQELVTQFITRHLLLMLISQPAHYRTAYLCIFTTKLPQGFAPNLACAVVYICVRVIYG